MSSPDVLLSFVGNRDPYPEGGDELGPVLSLLQARHFDDVYLFCTGPSYVERARTVEEASRTFGPAPAFSFITLDLASVIDYEEIYTRMTDTLHQVMGSLEGRVPTYHVLLDPGTPQMQTVWFLLAKSGFLPATLLQGIPPRFAAGAYKVRTVDLSSAVFPDVELRFAGQLRQPSHAYEVRRTRWYSPQEGERVIGEAPAFLEVLSHADRAAQYDISVLIRGESGTGKGLVARLIHERSARADQPYVAVNCATVAPALAESELFGHVRGAFTGAERERLGKFRSAEGGVILLDEIGDLPLDIQPKLLRVLEEKLLVPVGSDTEVRADVRVLAATNQDLERLIDEKRFRRDLYERLNQFTIAIPPLRDRPSDIVLLVESFLARWNAQYRERKHLSPEARAMLLAYPWPGNVREIQNAVTAMCATTLGDTVVPEMLPPQIREHAARSMAGSRSTAGTPEIAIPESGLDLKALLFQIEQSYYLEALRAAGGNREKAARMLGLNAPAYRKALRERLGVPDDE